jgi:catechol 2,3-dioxygenase-like lactoylglutathione lyase family enzyme
MQLPPGLNVLFIAGFGPVVRDKDASVRLYRDVLGIGFKEETGDYLHTEALEGAKTFALWPLAHAAHSCFGVESWPARLPVPQAWLEFDVDDVAAASAVLESAGYELIVRGKTEPWGQTISRFLSPEGILVGVACTPQLRAQR